MKTVHVNIGSLTKQTNTKLLNSTLNSKADPHTSITNINAGT